MPKETFLNLPKEKQDIIYKAAKKEFSRVPYTEASINQIIQSANISRGSFYMYFEDKEDLYEYLLTAHQKRLEDQCVKVLKEHDGNLIDTYLALYKIIVAKMNRKTKIPFFKRVIMNSRLHDKSVFANGHHKKFSGDVLALFHIEKMNVSNNTEFYEAIGILDLILSQALMRVSKGNMDEDVGYEKLKRELTILKEGLYYKEEKHD